MNILFCGYRPWAIDVYNCISSFYPEFSFSIVKDRSEFDCFIEENKAPNIIIMAGWSWIISDEIVSKIYTVGFHPSNLPAYAGGSPLQHQIIDGITKTKGTLFRATAKLDQGPIVYKENLSLEGGISDIFKNLTFCTIRLLTRFLDNFPDVPAIENMSTCKAKKRFRPEHSRLEKSEISKMNCIELYNFIRCKEDPYPNAFIEDETGTLIFKRTEFIHA